jgi:hypothetical protein
MERSHCRALRTIVGPEGQFNPSFVVVRRVVPRRFVNVRDRPVRLLVEYSHLKSSYQRSPDRPGGIAGWPLKELFPQGNSQGNEAKIGWKGGDPAEPAWTPPGGTGWWLTGYRRADKIHCLRGACSALLGRRVLWNPGGYGLGFRTRRAAEGRVPAARVGRRSSPTWKRSVRREACGVERVAPGSELPRGFERDLTHRSE